MRNVTLLPSLFVVGERPFFGGTAEGQRRRMIGSDWRGIEGKRESERKREIETAKERERAETVKERDRAETVVFREDKEKGWMG